MPDIGVVIIGRNEGERLRACLISALKQASKIVYVDSGSTDNSLVLATTMGVDTIALDRSKPFSAARARNEGFARLMAAHPMLDFVQFLDGDTVLIEGWMERAAEALNNDPKSAVVSGRRRESQPDASVFNRLCNIEWNKPVGKYWNFEGDALFRPHAFTQAGGFNPLLIAGEEPEFCSRLRAKGWDILRIDADMTWHDANMLRIGQWWKREVRAAYAYAESIATYGSLHGLKRSLGILFWAAILPITTLALLWPTRGISAVVALALLCVLIFRVYRNMRPRADSASRAFEYALFCALGKFPMLHGYLQYWTRRLTGHSPQLIEYKGASLAPAAQAAEQLIVKSAYLVNIYPRVSHTFIRREILALEAQGITVDRYSIRPCDTPLVDDTDKSELAKTRVITNVGAIGFLLAMLRTFLFHPRKFLMTMFATIKMGRSSDRGVMVNLAYFAEACVLRKWLGRSKICHLHAHHGTNSAAVAMLCRQLGGPSYSFTVHGPEDFERASKLALGKKVSMARFVVAISEFGRGQLCRWSDPDDWSKLQIVRCGVDDRFLTASVPPMTAAPRLVCVGRLCVEKGQLVLLEAACILRGQGLDFELVIAGDGPLREQLEQRIKDAGLEKHVRITGWLSSQQVKEEIIAARTLVLPSFAEGLPVVIMEALALGRPVISTPVAGIPELLKSGVNGWLVQPGSPEQLATAMAEALRTPVEMLARMGSAGAQAVALRHNASHEADKLRTLFQKDTNDKGMNRFNSNGHHTNGSHN